MELSKVATALFPIVEHAGNIELKYFYDEFEIMGKGDGSPVTLADREAEAYIQKELKEKYPDIPFIGEEAVEAGYIPDISQGTFWLVDALDGTKQFINKNNEFTVNIALMINFKPVLGVIYVPASKELYYGFDNCAYKRATVEGEDVEIKVREMGNDNWTIFDSRNHSNIEKLQEYLACSKIGDTIRCGSSIKFCKIAEGVADIYPRFWATSEWDTAAGHAILNAAGGTIETPEGAEFKYGKVDKKFINHFFIAYGKR